MVTEIWYPAPQSVKGSPTASYDVLALFSEEQRAQLDAPPLETFAVRDAPVATTHGPFPVVIFSHGHGGVRWQSTFLTVLLASHGYVVVAPDHTGGTLADAIAGHLYSVLDGLESRPLDVFYLMNALDHLKPEDFLYGHIDLNRLGMAGHSFGALTSLRVAASDPRKRLKVIVPQAPPSTDVSWLGLPMPVKLGIPVQIQGARLDRTLEWDENIAPAWAAQQRPRYLLEFPTGGHFTFSDICQLDLVTLAKKATVVVPDVDVEQLLGDGCGPEAPPSAVAAPIMNHYAIALFNAVLRENEASLGLLNQSAADAVQPGAAVFTADP